MPGRSDVHLELKIWPCLLLEDSVDIVHMGVDKKVRDTWDDPWLDNQKKDLIYFNHMETG